MPLIESFAKGKQMSLKSQQQQQTLEIITFRLT